METRRGANERGGRERACERKIHHGKEVLWNILISATNTENKKGHLACLHDLKPKHEQIIVIITQYSDSDESDEDVFLLFINQLVCFAGVFLVILHLPTF